MKNAVKIKEKIEEWTIPICYTGVLVLFFYACFTGFFEKAIMGLLYKYGLL